MKFIYRIKIVISINAGKNVLCVGNRLQDEEQHAVQTTRCNANTIRRESAKAI